MKEKNDYVICLECGLKYSSLVSHLLSKHNMTCEQYWEKHGRDKLIRSIKLVKKRGEANKKRKNGFGKGDTKLINCIDCGDELVVSKFFSLKIHNPRCDKCKKKQEDEKFINLSEPEDYVTCLECGYRTESLVTHVQKTHPDYHEKHPDALMMSLNCSVRDRSHQIGSKRSLKTRIKMSKNAGRWNKSLNKEIDERLLRSSEKMKGRSSWNKGKTAENCESIARTVEKLKLYYKIEKRPCRNGLKVILDEDTLLEFSKNGKIHIGKAIAKLGYSFQTIKKECKRNGLETFNRLISQTICLETISKALNGLGYEQEWKDNRFKSNKGGFFRFDGFFPDIKLVVEFHGNQHFGYCSFYHRTEQDYLDMVERDRIKNKMIKEADDLNILIIREDEPFNNVDYMKKKLIDLGIIKVE